MNLEQVSALVVPLPPLNEIHEIVNALQLSLDSISEQSKSIETMFALGKAQRQNILRAAFSGQLVPQDPSDEPASVLLACIRAERASKAAAAAKPKAARKAANNKAAAP